MLTLPIDAHLPAITRALSDRRALVLVAEPGAGKTTRVPRALLDAGFGERGEILVLEPRRIAARMAARRVADELGEDVGGRIGYQVRYENVGSARTRVRFITEGILTRRLVDDPTLKGVSAVVLDEFHERHIHADVGLALLRRLQRGSRPDLALCVMSATLAADPLTRFLDAPSLHVPGRPYPVSVDYIERPADVYLEKQVTFAFSRLLREGLSGDVLVFLPGAAEIRRAQEACTALAREAGVEIALLHGDLSPSEQDRAVRRTERRKLILSTNVAETSLTIEGVVAVIDSGLARVAGHSPFSGLPTLGTAPISRASAEQRAGRAGRMGPGVCLRLYGKHDHDARPLHDKPELARADLSETFLTIATSEGTLGPSDWFEPPPEAAWQAARAVLAGLGALEVHGDTDRITPLGRRMADKPMHPRLARLVFEAEARGAGASGCLLAALLSERDVLLTARARFGEHRQDHGTASSDLLHRLELIEAAGEDAGASRLRGYDLDAGAVAGVLRARDRLVRVFSARDDFKHTEEQREEALLLATTAAFFDRVAKRRSENGSDVVFARGGSAQLSETSVVRNAQYMVVVSAHERKGGRGVVAHMASALTPESLLELFPERIVDETRLSFDTKTQRVSSVQTLSYDGLALDSARSVAAPSTEAARVLFEAAKERGVSQLVDVSAYAALRERIGFARAIDASIPALPDDALEQAVLLACDGCISFSELEQVPVLELVQSLLPHNARARVAQLTPDQIALPSGRKLRVHYERDRPPWVESRLQDFFGMKDGPRLGDKALVLHLLAPNQRAVQVTSDLAGFWTRHYAEVRRELMRRYPRHAWPDDPRTAKPPEPQPPRRR